MGITAGFRRVYVAAGFLLTWAFLPVFKSATDSVNLNVARAPSNPGPGTEALILQDPAAGHCQASQPCLRDVVIGPRFEPPDRLDAASHNPSSAEIWFLWFLSWWGTDPKIP